MQSNGGVCLLYSCYDFMKSAVMGCCYSICPQDADPQENIVNERTHLLEVSGQQQESPAPSASASTPPRRSDEQSALNRILHETASNVIDVGALGPYTLEAGAYSERVRAYSARLASVPAAPARPPRILLDVPVTERTLILSKPGLSGEDKEYITNFVKKAAAAISELRVEHHEDLVVPFRVP